ncbi:tRNA(Ile)-lysidine synthase [Amphibacillus marinus]|uniref:tRNA(Ile)-lysidine synthase n=1 Tax=Amphibacillus marinus TaxID=872970 RepID=A0A1H8TJZ0_9BACI|nr:tRNA lysidine(34) synthetase TilS [Amphibacillus marinus]SEO91390.1 tRNA(Ile)-lysidine synthase [Amphibacillus marinus]
MLVDTVDLYVSKFNLIEKNKTVIVGVSGGPDSMALLHYLIKKREEWRLRLIVISINHALRGEDSIQDTEYVKHFCQENALEFEVSTVDVKGLKAEAKMGTQEAARTLRYQVFEQMMDKYNATYLALAHHGDDQIETVFMRLTRGTQTDMLKGMLPSRPIANGHLIRPFLCLAKKDIEGYCKEQNIVPRRDPSNNEDTYTRNYFRIHVLPLLREQNPNLLHTIQQFTEHAQDDSLALKQMADQVARRIVTYQAQPPQVSCSINDLKKHPRALQRRLFHLILNYLYNTLPSGLNYRHEQQFFNMLTNERANASIDLPNKLKMTRSYHLLMFYYEENREGYQMVLNVPGTTRVSEEWSLLTELVTDCQVKTRDENVFYWPYPTNYQSKRLFIRSRQPGDRIYIESLKGHKKVSRLFIDHKIPVHRRDHWPILVNDQGELLWVLGLAKRSHDQQLEGEHYIKIFNQFNNGL